MLKFKNLWFTAKTSFINLRILYSLFQKGILIPVLQRFSIEKTMSLEEVLHYLKKFYNFDKKKKLFFDLKCEKQIRNRELEEMLKLYLTEEDKIILYPPHKKITEEDFPTANTITEEEIEIEMVSVDEDISEKITFLKMDTEGAEQKAIMGSKNYIKNEKPKLAISIYYKNEDLRKILLLLFYAYDKIKLILYYLL